MLLTREIMAMAVVTYMLLTTKYEWGSGEGKRRGRCREREEERGRKWEEGSERRKRRESEGKREKRGEECNLWVYLYYIDIRYCVMLYPIVLYYILTVLYFDIITYCHISSYQIMDHVNTLHNHITFKDYDNLIPHTDNNYPNA